jgi:hypothetical protein
MRSSTKAQRLPRMSAKRGRRSGPLHDDLSRRRQQASATALLVVTPLAAAAFYITVRLIHWPDGNALTSPGGNDHEMLHGAMFVAAALLTTGWILLMVASGALIYGRPRIVNATRMMLHSVDSPPPPLEILPAPERSAQYRARHIYYYSGVICLLLAVSELVLATGGLSSSPFTAVLLTFLASAQALGRFRTNCRVFSAIGLAILIGIGALDSAGISHTNTQPPPAALARTLTILGFLIGAVITYNSKLENPLATSVTRPFRRPLE